MNILDSIDFAEIGRSVANQAHRLIVAQLRNIPEDLWPFAQLEYANPGFDFDTKLDQNRNEVTISTTTPAPRVRVPITTEQFDRWNAIRSEIGAPPFTPDDLPSFWVVRDAPDGDAKGAG